MTGGRAEAAPDGATETPRPGELRVINGNLCRFIERDLRGDVWEVLGPAPAGPTQTPQAEGED